MTLPADNRDILDRISAQLAAEEPHLTGMYRVFSRLTARDLIPDEDAVRRPAGPGGYGPARAGGPVAGGLGAGGLRLRGRTVLTGRQARIMAVPALLLAILITVIARGQRMPLHPGDGAARGAGRGGRVQPERRRGPAADEPLRAAAGLAADPGRPALTRATGTEPARRRRGGAEAGRRSAAG